MFVLADYLKQPLSVILDMSQAEFRGWVAYLKDKREQERKQYGHQRNPRN